MTEQARTALVTGASRGIGRAIALGLARRGYDVAVNDIERQKDALLEVVREIEALGRKALPVFADVGAKAEVAAMVAS
ncbi:MAG: SDR family NAD(P)-dependent oxidoreductase, partial [Rhizobiales bacterium]|nr:SDR family NAD(P)-dependent oxidoreductase [Hyphomicrobiales bacterium]